MSTPIADVHAWLEAHESEMVADLQAMLRIASIEGPAAPNAPFGVENREALDLALGWCDKAGMATKDLDGYIGYGDFGQGANLVAIFGHLDVVPVGAGWKHEPFGAEIDGDYLYARGATDDKGPSVAAFYACRAIKECVPNLKSRIRMAFGCNEESGFKCIDKYAAEDEAPTYGFAPDAGWPLVYAEKGIGNLTVSRPLIGGDMELLYMRGGQRPNIVIDACEAAIRISDSFRAEFDGKLADAWDKNLSFVWEGSTLKIFAKGKAAHGAWPYGGDSAAARILRFLMELSPVATKREYEDLFETSHISGMGIGIHGSDEISELTSNLGIVTTENGRLRLLYNVRYPVTWTGDMLKAKCEAFLAKLSGGYSLDVDRDSPPLYFPVDHPLTKTVLDVVEIETGERGEPAVIGGGTYARAVPNTVAIGTGWQGDGEAHQTDERIKVAHVLRMAKIYAHVIWRLSELG